MAGGTLITNTQSQVLKEIYLGPIQDLLNETNILMKRLTRNTEDFIGNRGVLALHSGRNPHVGARENGARLPARGKQTHINAYIDTKHTYGVMYVDGVTMRKTRGSKGAFARVVDTEIKGLTRDMNRDVNRQLFADGSGVLCINAGTSETGATGNTIYPYLWDPAARYLKNRPLKEIQSLTVADMTTLDPATADDDTTGLRVSSTTTDSTLYWETGTWASATAGDPIGGYRSIQDGSVRYEMMGLYGICTDSNLLGDYNWDYPGEYTAGNQGAGASGAFIGPEGQSYTYAITGIDNTLQSVDADANSQWRGYVNGNNGVPRAFSVSLMDKAFGELQTERDADLSLIISTWKVRNKYKDEIQVDRRYVNTMKLDGGFKAVDYNGLPFVVDRDCPRGTIFLLDESVLQLFVLQNFDWITDNSGQVLHWISRYNAFEASLWYSAELATRDRGKCGMIVDINEA